MIGDYSVSSFNASCAVSAKLDLHVVGTFVATVKLYFNHMCQEGNDASILAKANDLKSAYRQIPIYPDHAKFAYFCIYNHGSDPVDIYRSLTIPFGATHSVYNCLKLARMLRLQGSKASDHELL